MSGVRRSCETLAKNSSFCRSSSRRAVTSRRSAPRRAASRPRPDRRRAALHDHLAPSGPRTRSSASTTVSPRSAARTAGARPGDKGGRRRVRPRAGRGRGGSRALPVDGPPPHPLPDLLSLEIWLLGRPFIPALGVPMLLLAVPAAGLRYWVIRTLDGRWTTRIAVLPGMPPDDRRAVPVPPPSQLPRRDPGDVRVAPDPYGVAHSRGLQPAQRPVLRVRIRAEEEACGAEYEAACGRGLCRGQEDR